MARQDTNVDDALSILLDQAPQQGASPEEIAGFDELLDQMASADFADQGFRAAALQFRLPDSKVKVNEEGNLSFSDFEVGEESPVRTDAFRSKRVKSAGNAASTGAFLFGDAINVVSLGTGNQYRDKAKRAEQTFGTKSTAILGLRQRMADISEIEDLGDRGRALLDLESSVALALNDRRVELIDQAGAKYRISELEQQLVFQESQDRAHPSWNEIQQDSDETARARAALANARAQAQQEGERMYMTDSLVNDLSAGLRESQGLYELDRQEGIDPLNSYSDINQRQLKAMYELSKGTSGTDEELADFASNNDAARLMLDGDIDDQLLVAFTPGSKYHDTLNVGLFTAEKSLVGSEARAKQRMEGLKANYDRVLAVLGAEDGDLRKFPEIQNNKDLQALREDQAKLNSPTSLLTPTQKAAQQAAMAKRAMGIARTMLIAQEASSFMSATTHAYIPATSPEIATIVQEAKDKNMSPMWIIEQAGAAGVGSHATRYLANYWEHVNDSAILGSSRQTRYYIDSYSAGFLTTGQAGSITTPGQSTNFDVVGSTVTQGARDINTGLAYINPLYHAASLLDRGYDAIIDWGNAPAGE